ncbi:MAG: DUF4870 domain-containing protein [Candidatus Woesearchaeota archaeon]
MASDDRTLPILTHVLGYLFGWLAPLIVLLASEREDVKQHARRALNWQISYIVYIIILFIVLIVSIPLAAIGIGILTFVLAMLLVFAVAICDLVFSIIAAVKASSDELYTYPLSIGFVRDPPQRSPPQRPQRQSSAPRTKAARSTTEKPTRRAKK